MLLLLDVVSVVRPFTVSVHQWSQQQQQAEHRASVVVVQPSTASGVPGSPATIELSLPDEALGLLTDESTVAASTSQAAQAIRLGL